jgi:hypothetical protein
MGDVQVFDGFGRTAANLITLLIVLVFFLLKHHQYFLLLHPLTLSRKKQLFLFLAILLTLALLHPCLHYLLET